MLLSEPRAKRAAGERAHAANAAGGTTVRRWPSATGGALSRSRRVGLAGFILTLSL